MTIDERFMLRCIELARNGFGWVAPNPMVGSVLVLDGKIVSEGYHRRYGGPHAEVECLREVNDPDVLSRATLYVSLEPCAHHGKTPPCADLIVQKGIKKVVIGCRDPFSEVDGKGIARLQQAGIEVQIGILEGACRELNKRFFCLHEKKRPFVVLKWAQTQDGFMDRIRQPEEQGVNWITCAESKSLVHYWRSTEQAILVGKNTVLTDNPALTVREVTGRNPIRVVLDSQLTLADSSRIFREDGVCLVLNQVKDAETEKIRYIRLADRQVQSILDTLYQHNIQSVLIEGGAQVLQQFVAAGLWDEARVLTGSVHFGTGLKAPVLPLPAFKTEKHFADSISYFQNV